MSVNPRGRVMWPSPEIKGTQAASRTTEPFASVMVSRRNSTATRRVFGKAYRE